MKRVILCGVIMTAIGGAIGCGGKDDKVTPPTKTYAPPEPEQEIGTGGGKNKKTPSSIDAKEG